MPQRKNQRQEVIFMRTTDTGVQRLVMAALFAALCCVSTMIIQIPSPMNGYVNPGDCFVLLSGWLLGPLYGTLAAGIGSMLADLFTGYAHYALATFLIKGAMALTAYLLCKKLGAVLKDRKLLPMLLSAVSAECIMVVGYYFFAGLILGKGLGALGAAASVPGNIMQGAVGAVLAILIMSLLRKQHIPERFHLHMP